MTATCFDVHTDINPSRTTVSLTSELDSTSVGPVPAAGRETATSRSILLDLSGLQFIDRHTFVFLRAASAEPQVEGREVRFVGATAGVQRAAQLVESFDCVRVTAQRDSHDRRPRPGAFILGLRCVAAAATGSGCR